MSCRFLIKVILFNFQEHASQLDTNKMLHQVDPLPSQTGHVFSPDPLQLLHSLVEVVIPPTIIPLPLHLGHFIVPFPLHLLHVAIHISSYCDFLKLLHHSPFLFFPIDILSRIRKLFQRIYLSILQSILQHLHSFTVFLTLFGIIKVDAYTDLISVKSIIN